MRTTLFEVRNQFLRNHALVYNKQIFFMDLKRWKYLSILRTFLPRHHHTNSESRFRCGFEGFTPATALVTGSGRSSGWPLHYELTIAREYLLLSQWKEIGCFKVQGSKWSSL